MCGRFTLEKPNEICPHFNISIDGIIIEPRFNIAPNTYSPIIRLNNNDKELASCFWGLVPSWIKDSKIKPINAKSETVRTKPFFRSAFKKKRCIVPASGFYEWAGVEGLKSPHYIYPKNQPFFGFAGLWEQKGDLQSFTILTTQANEDMVWLHSRMPVILSPNDYDQWLQKGSYDLLKPAQSNTLELHQVSKKVNNPKNDSPDLIVNEY